MGIAGDKPRQLAPTVGTTGSGSTDSPAPSSTTSKIDINTIVGIAAPTDVDTTSKIDIDTIVGIAAPTDIDTTSKINIDTIVGIAAPTDVDTTSKIDIVPSSASLCRPPSSTTRWSQRSTLSIRPSSTTLRYAPSTSP
jgi:hypothetical protein